jgi:hypothetical protein
MPAQTIEDVSMCPILKDKDRTRETQVYPGGMPNQRTVPSGGYNCVKCEHYIQESGKCKLQFFFPRYAELDYNPCIFAEKQEAGLFLLKKA